MSSRVYRAFLTSSPLLSLFFLMKPIYRSFGGGTAKEIKLLNGWIQLIGALTMHEESMALTFI